MPTTLATKTIAPPTRYLYGPGPSTVDPRAYQAMSQPIVGLRDPYFLEIMADIQAGLRVAFGTKNEKMFLVPASGSGAMETAVVNFVKPGSKAVVFSAGVFAERIATMAERQRAQVVKITKPWGEIFTADEARVAIEREQPDVVAFVQAETSTGAYQSGRAIAAAAKQASALVIADCITSVGAMPAELDAVGIDVAFTCSQKGLSCPAGLSPLTCSPGAWQALSDRKEAMGTWYFDLRIMDNYFTAPHTYQHTPSPPLYYALHQALAVIEEEGLENRWQRHKRAGERLLAGVSALGFSPFVEDPDQRLWHLLTARPPADIDEAKLRGNLLARHNIEVGAGLGQLTGKIVRLGVMGPLATDENVDTLIDALRDSL